MVSDIQIENCLPIITYAETSFDVKRRKDELEVHHYQILKQCKGTCN